MRYRPALDHIAPYVQGKPAPVREAPTYKLSSNENPYPPLPAVITALQGCLGTVNRYPSMGANELVAALAAALTAEAAAPVAPDQIVLGAGSVEIVSALIRAVAGEGDEVVYAWRSFEAYPSLVYGAGATPVEVPLTDDLAHDLPAMAAAITPRTRCVIVCNPNNPTGTVIAAEDFAAFMAQVPGDLPVVLDEAYRQFNQDASSPDGLKLLARYPNLVVCHTFSKAYGLAGLRIGYMAGRRELAEQVRKLVIPFGVSDLAQKAALASLAAEDELGERVARIVAARRAVEEELAEQGWQTPASQANFIWLPTGASTTQAAPVLDDAGIVARVFPGDGIRVTIAEPESLPLLVDAAAKVYKVLHTNAA